MSINKMQYNASDILNYPTNHHDPTIQTNYANNVKNWVETEKNLVDTILWQPNTAYSVGNMVKTPSLPSQYCLVCTTAGTSGANEPSYSGVSDGSNVTDGSVTWMASSLLPAMGGTITFGTTLAARRSVNNSYTQINGGSATADGANLILFGKDESRDGAFWLTANNGSTSTQFIGKADGTLTWDGKNIALTNSPAFTGTPTAPTPSAGDNSYKIATTAYVKSCIPKSTGNSTTPVYIDSSGNITTGDKYVSASVLGTVLTSANNYAYSLNGAEHQIEIVPETAGTWVVTAHAKFTSVQAGKRYGIELSKEMGRVNIDDEACVIVHSSGTGAISLVTTGIFTMKSTDDGYIYLNAYSSAEATIDSCRIRAVRIK